PQNPDVFYYWSNDSTTRTIQVTTAGDYWVQIYNATCSGFSQIHVGVRTQLQVDFTNSQSGNCLPVPMQFTDNAATCGVGVVYRRWNFDNGDSSLLPNPVYIYQTGGAHTVSLTERDNTGLEITTTKTVYVNTNAGLVFLGNDTTLCYGNRLVLDAGTLATKYLWSTGDTTRTISVKEPGTYSVTVGKNSCQGADTLVVATVFPLAPAIGSNITSRCLPVAVRFTDNTLTVCGTAPITGWAWDFGDGSISTDPAPVHSYRKAGPFTVKLTVTDSLGVNAAVTKDIKIVTIGPVPPAMDAAAICLGKTVSLDAGNEGATYAWTPATHLSNDTVRNPEASPVVTTLFKVDITKCGVTVADSVMVYVDSVATPIIESDGKTLTAQPGITYAWFKDGVLIPGAASRTYKPVVGAYYQVEISNSKGCYGRSGSYFFLPEGVSIPG
ncbi:MAG TPA: PKD domain-containing protein, partial [Chitinophagaceae bacterium]|nr:PKD domain-containing protein [Chitinophagaceae bacterium]